MNPGMSCESMKGLMLLYLYDELEESQRDALEEHADSCKSCAAALHKERQFLGSLNEREVPSAALLAECRHGLMRGVHRLQSEQPAYIAGVIPAAWWNRLRQGFPPLRPAWQPAAAMALLAVGFYAGRFIESAPTGSPLSLGGPMQQSSLAPLGPFGDIQSVTLDPGQGEVEIVVEEITRRTIRGAPGDPHIRGMLISTVREYPNSGVRLDTLDILSAAAADREVRRVLRETMIGDRNPGVRLRAFEALRPHKSDPETRQALIEVLLTDDNPGMRVQAIDLLTENPDRDLVGLLQGLVERDQNNYIRLQSRRILHDLNASVERF